MSRAGDRGVWTPQVSVAAIAADGDHYLLVEEMARGRRVFNQPGGHLEEGESLAEAVVREVLEEAAAHFAPEGVVGLYRWREPRTRETHLRVAFHGRIVDTEAARGLDDGIVAAHWLAYATIAGLGARLRNPMVLGCIDDFRRGRSFPLDFVRDLV